MIYRGDGVRMSTLLAISGLIAAALPGCGASRVQRRDAIRVDDLTKEASAAEAAKADRIARELPRPARPATQSCTQVETQSAEAASEGVIDVVAAAGDPAPLPAAAPVQSSVLADATVGEVNGRPVMVSGLLEPLGPRLAALSRERGMTRERWREEARRAIDVALRTFIEEELLRAEAMASFTPEQKQGFVAFMEDVQRRFQGQSLGSSVVANERLFEKEGRTLDDWRREEELKQLIGFVLSSKVYNRVQVSRRDTQVYYSNNIEKFRPPPKAKFRRIGVKAGDSATIEEIAKRLASGETMTQIASSPANKQFRGNNDGLYVVEFVGEQGQATFFNTPEINAIARRLPVGSVEGPIEVNGIVQWLGLEAIDAQSQDWYDAQLSIEQQLRNRQARVHHARYIEQLKTRASFTAVDEMFRRLMVIAEERYFQRDAVPPPPNTAK